MNILQLSVYYGNNVIMEEILNKKTLTIDTVIEGDTTNALHVAASRPASKANTFEIFQTLLTFLEKLEEEKRRELLNELNNTGEHLLILSLKSNRIKLFKTLLSMPEVNLNLENSNGETPLIFSIRNKITPAIKMLLANKKCSVKHFNKGKSFPQISKICTLTFLKKKQTEKPVCGLVQSPLHWAVLMQNTKVIYTMLKRSAPINKECEGGATPLHWAVETGKIPTVKLLLAAGAKIKSTRWKGSHVPEYGDSPLHAACALGHYHIAKLLIEANADYNQPNHYGKTCLYLAAENSHFSIVQMLLELPNIDLNRKALNGLNALMVCSTQQCYNLIIRQIGKNAI